LGAYFTTIKLVVKIMDNFHQWFPTKRKTVIIPDGYKGLCAIPSSKPTFNKAESGFWIADFGPEKHIEPGFKIVENIIQDDPTSSVIWVLQKTILDYWATDTLRVAELLGRFHRIQQFRVSQGGAGKEMLSYWPLGPINMSELLSPNPPVQQSRVADVVVVVDKGSGAQALVSLFRSAGIPTYLPNPENDIFLEIHTPDKIIVGVPGSTIAFSSEEQTLLQLYWEQDKLGNSSDAGEKLLEIERRKLHYIEQVLRARISFVHKFLGIKERKNDPLLSDLMEQYSHAKDSKLYNHFIQIFLRSKLGVQVSGGVEKDGKKLTSTSESPVQFKITNSGDGLSRILVYADPPVYAMRFGEEFNSIVSGDEILKIVVSIPDCAGAYVNSALKQSGMLINRKTAISVIKS